MCVSAPTASTTVRIAGKPATSPWLAAVATELQNLHLQIDADPRLAAAAGGVARYLADAAGLEDAAATRLQSAVIAACSEAFEHLSARHPHLEITFARLPDRIEVALSHEGEPAPTLAGALAGVDRVQCETRGAETVTRLTKYLGEVAPNI